MSETAMSKPLRTLKQWQLRPNVESMVDEVQQPEWQPISMLPLIADLMDDALADGKNLLDNLQRAAEMPHMFDDRMADRTIALYTEALDFVGMYSQQLDRWAGETIDPEQMREIDRLQALLPQMRQMAETIIEAAGQIRSGTIDRIMEMSDAELGMRALLGKDVSDR